MQENRSPIKQSSDWPWGWLFLLLILGFSVVLRFLDFAGVCHADDFMYCHLANELLSGTYALGNHAWYAFRFAIFLPVTVFFALFGVNDYSACAWPFLASTGTLVALFLIMRRLHTTAAAFFACTLLATSPIFITWGRLLLPDSIMTFFLVAAIAVFIEGDRTAYRRSRITLFVLCGLLVFGGHLSRAIAVPLFAIFWTLYILLHRRFNWTYTLPIVVILVTIFGEFVLYWARSGDPLLRLHVLQRFYGNQKLPLKPGFYLGIMIRDVLRSELLPTKFLVLPGLVALGITFWRGRRRTPVLLMVLLVAWWLFMEFGSQSLTSYRPMFKQERFALLLLVVFYGICGWILDFWIFPTSRILSEIPGRNRYSLSHNFVFTKKRGGKVLLNKVPIVFISVLLLLASMYIYKRPGQWDFDKSYISKYKMTANFISKLSKKPIYIVHWRWSLRLKYFLKFDPEYKFIELKDIINADEIENAYVVFDKKFTEIKDFSYDELPTFLNTPPENWKLLNSDQNVLIYDIN